MLAIILGILVTIASLMLAFFLAVSNVSFIVESDFMSKAYKNAEIHALTDGQLRVRAGEMGPNSTTNNITVNPGYLRDFRDGTYTNMSYNITYVFNNSTQSGDIDVSVSVK